MAVQDPQTTNIGLPLKVNGHVALQKTVKRGFEMIDSILASFSGSSVDARFDALEARVLELETKLNDSNSQFFDGDPG